MIADLRAQEIGTQRAEHETLRQPERFTAR